MQEPGSDSNLALTSNDCMVGLLSLELINIRPNYEAMVRAGHLKPTDISGNGMFNIESLKDFNI